MLEGVARFSYRHKWLMLLIWILLLAGTVILAETQGGKLNNNFSLPGTETQETLDLLEEKMPARAGTTGEIVFRAEDGVEAVRARMEAGFDAARRASGEYLVSLTSPYTPEGARQVAPAGPSAGRIAYAELQFDRGFAELPIELSDEIQEAVNEAVRPDDKLTVEYGGPPFQELALRSAATSSSGWAPRCSYCSSPSARCWRWACRFSLRCSAWGSASPG